MYSMKHIVIEDGQPVEVFRLPSYFQPEDRADYYLGEGHTRVCAIIKKVHFTKSKVTYDLKLIWGEHNEYQTRIYNVDSVFVVKCQILGTDGVLREQD